jgi:starch synthase
LYINLDERYEFGVHYGTGNGGIKYYFLHNANLFPRPYPDFGPAQTVREIASFAKASLQLLCDLQIIPSIILTNDWFTGLTPAYAKNGSFGDTFRGTTFMHICHNLEPTYEGRLYPSPQEGTLQGIYQFDPNWIIDFTWKQRVINPSRCAIMMSDQWATVSNSYKQDLKNSSPLNYFLNQKPHPFSYPNGIFKEKRLKKLNEECKLTRPECKKYIQQKYFGYQDVDYSVPIFSFVGRITQQKGVLLILDCVEEMIRITNGKINILVGGMGDRRDPYVGACVNKMYYLKGKYPYAFWADPNEFFTDGPKINKGSDFGLMPSFFEPGGIVQHEFFIAGTPVIAFRTGGLKDTVFEFLWDNNTGNGLTFDYYNGRDLVSAMRRALNLFENKEKYEICRRNAFNSAIDVADVARAWCREFYRLKNKIYFNVKEAKNLELDKEKEKEEKEKEKALNLSIKKEKTEKKKSVDKEIDINEKNVTFSYKFVNNRNPKTVLISGSFDDWKEKHPLKYDNRERKWICKMNLKKGKYYFKYIIDGNWEINPNEKQVRGSDGIINNVIEV